MSSTARAFVLFEAEAIVRRGLPCNPTKRGAECARPTETDLERDLGNGCTRICQQCLRALDPPRCQVAMGRLPKGPLERSQEMIRAQAHKLGQCIKGNVFGKVPAQ
jgi:hypothetical protein